MMDQNNGRLQPASNARARSFGAAPANPRLSWPLGMLTALGLANSWILTGWFQLFQPPGWVDPGIYLGYFVGLSEKISQFGANYFSMRLPFTALGAVFFELFPPILAQKLIIVAFNSLAAVSLFAILARRTSIGAAIVASWWLTFNPSWLAAVSRGYVDGPAMALLMAALALLDQREHSMRPRLMTAAAGVFVASAAFTHPITILLFGLAALAELAVVRPRMFRVFSDTALLVAGAAAATVIFGFISLYVGGKFLFFLADPYAFARSFQGFGANYRSPLFEWIPHAYRLAPPAASLILGVLLLACRDAIPFRALLMAGLTLVGGITSFLFYWDYVVGGATLQSSFYSSYMLVGQALIFGSAVAMALGSAGLRTSFITISLLLALAWLVFRHVDWIWACHAADGDGWIVAWLGIVILFALATFLLYTRLSILAVFLIFGATAISGVFNYDTRRIFISKSGVDFETVFNTTMTIASFVNANKLPNTKLAFWFDRDTLKRTEEHRSFFTTYRLRFRDNVLSLNYWDSLVALWQWDRSLLGANMPGLDIDQEKWLQSAPKWTIATLCLLTEHCENAASRLVDHGFVTAEIAKMTVDEGYVRFTVVMYEVQVMADENGS